MLRDPRPADAARYAQAFVDDPRLSARLGFDPEARMDNVSFGAVSGDPAWA